MERSRFLQIVSFVIVISGIISIMYSIQYLGIKVDGISDQQHIIWLVFHSISIIAGIVQVIAGIFGALYWATPKKAKLCLLVGIVRLVLQLVIYFISLTLSTLNVDLIIGILLPILYLIGAYILNGYNTKKAKK